MHPIVIIGSGMAGYTLAREFRKLNPDQALIMISADDAANYAKPTLSNALAANKHPDQIALADAQKMSQQLNMQIMTHTTVTQIDAANHQIQLIKDGQQSNLDYAKLVLALGASPIRLAFAGINQDEVPVVNSLHDYREFRQRIEQSQNKNIVILGAGLIGCEFANDLQHTGHQVDIVDLAPHALGRLMPSHVAEAFQEKLEQTGIRFHFKTTVEKMNKVENGYQVHLSNGQILQSDLVLSAIGLQPNTQLAQNAQIKCNRGILTNPMLETNQQDIYALGDCVEVADLVLPYVMPLMQQARALAKTLNHQNTAIHYPAMPVAVKTPAAPLTVLPAPLNIELDWQTESFEDGMLSKAIDTAGTLRAFVLLGATAAKQRLALTKLVPDLVPVAE
ncbi:NAD(P)/FAD-dependent oxidoreductase [Acinetobacter rudis]|uniref:FAD-dependent oxidoreductase n=1 Tax=Acinetobacter rudis TaxID=632955 RepID=A0AAW8J3P1_9GAMM|nr:FAD-dependent oxidoreductase [Acinetobacter rudis]MDQ8934647.1 FAD-dependent oxidoreductase [Acinetobacter rudis]MDQ8951588.1 FAD-dependent oxidoreductase [Acinetobacter rudis]MDQ9016783.1 FAD-dependent oxidoreductase [Acinetobacter rudis]